MCVCEVVLLYDFIIAEDPDCGKARIIRLNCVCVFCLTSFSWHDFLLVSFSRLREGVCRRTDGGVVFLT